MSEFTQTIICLYMKNNKLAKTKEWQGKNKDFKKGYSENNEMEMDF